MVPSSHWPVVHTPPDVMAVKKKVKKLSRIHSRWVIACSFQLTSGTVLKLSTIWLQLHSAVSAVYVCLKESENRRYCWLCSSVALSLTSTVLCLSHKGQWNVYMWTYENKRKGIEEEREKAICIYATCLISIPFSCHISNSSYFFQWAVT